MVLSPGAEVYFLDTAGKEIAFHAPENEIVLRTVLLPPIKKYIQTKGEKYINGTDQKTRAIKKFFRLQQ